MSTDTKTEDSTIPINDETKGYLISFLVSRLSTRNIPYVKEVVEVITVVTAGDLKNLIGVTLQQFKDEIKKNPTKYPALSLTSSNQQNHIAQEAIAGKLPLPDGKWISKHPPITPYPTEPDHKDPDEKDVCLRLEIHDFVKANNKKQRDLFLQAYQAMQNQQNEDDWRNFYRIGGIHGAPYEAYNGDRLYTEQGQGYCHHGTVLFPSWHRAYMLLIENSIRERAASIAANYQKDVAEWKEAARTLRFPYWDWASELAVYEGVPSIFTDETVKVDSPTGESEFANPLRSYTLPETISKVRYGEHNNPYQYTYRPDGPPYTPAGSSTVRHPDVRFQTNVDQLNLSATQYCTRGLRAGVWHMFQVNEYAKFSNHYGAVNKDTGEIVPARSGYGHYASIESVHDMVHDFFGGVGGHMSYPALAAFDPIFFIHHCNVDRLYALWQACYPDEKIPDSIVPDGTASIKPGGPAGSTTQLAPFYKGPGDPMIPTDMLDTRKWGYTYPELEDEKKRQDLLREKKKGEERKEKKEVSLLDRLLLKYAPDGNYEVRWLLEFPRIPKRLLGGPFRIYVFIDFPEVADLKKDWHWSYLRKPNFAGAVSIFAREKDDACETCKIKDCVRGQVDLTDTMFKLGLNVTSEAAITGGNGADVIFEPPEKPVTGPIDGSTSLPEPFKEPVAALQIVVIKEDKKIDPELVGLKRSEIFLECFKLIGAEEKGSDLDKIKKKPLLPFQQLSIAMPLARQVIRNIASLEHTVVKPMMTKTFSARLR